MYMRQATMVGLILTSFATVQARQTTPATIDAAAGSQRQASLTRADRDFLTYAAADGRKEIAFGQLAEEKSTSPLVRALAQRIRKDHLQADRELKALAKAKGVMLPAPRDHTAEIAKLQKLEEARFDRTYSNMMVVDHRNGIVLFERASRSLDSDIRAFAQKTLPALREHLKLSEEALAAAAGSVRRAAASDAASSQRAPTPR
jgi:putative membrane protein